MDSLQMANVVRQSGGLLHGSCSQWTDVEFPTLARGTDFIEVMGWADVARLRDAVTDHRAPVVFQIPNKAVAYWGTDEHVEEYLKEHK
ncbi:MULTISPECIES: hypothetical protein [Streptomyces]|uniref:hypothetical protein n=1 Tax=Streptomyces TaxID=1883 RepID=UPI001E31B041|nr:MULTISPECIES: hypothetical protein [Streptomyces]UFQ16449.1 hypothetical protein J2N69_16350 [Streptomyces huasconensis]WCL86051.1 hypothetical protein PPN52_16360 [Streptomyces sp. JCM 35825]